MKSTLQIIFLACMMLAISACAQANNTPDAIATEPIEMASSTPLANVTLVVPNQTSLPTAASVPTNTPVPAATASAAASGTCTNSADFVTDISIPDGTTLTSNSSFIKTWRIKNTGTCSWDSGYSLVFVDGTLLMPVNYAPLPGTIAPGQTFDLSLNMTAPIYPGNYESDWKLRTPSGALFGVGQKDAPLWVKISIGSPNTTNIMGIVYQDRNQNDVYDGDDVLMSNREVWLQQGTCGQGGSRLASTTSGSDGHYVLSGAFNGSYCVVLSGVETSDDSTTINIASGQTLTNIDLRAVAPIAKISGWVWNAGLQQVGIAGAVVVAQRGECGSPTSVTISAITDADGHYTFGDLYGGAYCVSIRTYEGTNASIFVNGSWSYPANGIQQVIITPGQEGIANFGWQYK